MERQVNFRDYQEQVASDHNNIQAYARQSLDHIVSDAVTQSRKYSGFLVSKSAQAEVTVMPGRFYAAGGAVYARANSQVQSLISFLPAAAKRIVAVSCYGSDQDTDIEERDFLVDVTTGATEPDAGAMTSARTAVISFTSGSESADPQPPPLPDTHAAIAYILLDPTQVVSITMLTDNAVASTENLDGRARALEAFRAAIEPRVSSLASDVASLANDLKRRSLATDLSKLYIDMARVKDLLAIPDAASDYGADHFLNTSESDVANTASLGFDALVQEGIRFPYANQGIGELSIFSANDPNAKITSGLLLPAFDHVVRLGVGDAVSDLGIAQYGFQTFDMVQRTMSRQRTRYGDGFTVCTNAQWWKDGTLDPVSGIFTRAGETFQIIGLDANYGVGHEILRLRQFWVDTYDEPYWDYVVLNHTITGAQVAQTFLVGNDFWLTRAGFWLTAKAANEAVFLTICEVTNGTPDLKKVILQQTIPHTSLLTGNWTETDVVPTFLKAGKRYAMVLTSNANHRVAMVPGQNYLDGTFFYSTDGAYYQGDLTKDMAFLLYGAKFRAAQVTIEMAALNLDGGIRNIDIMAGAITPASTSLIYEVQPGGSGEWFPISYERPEAFVSTPPLARFRARFVGTRDMMPGVTLTGSQWQLSRPKLAFTHISSLQTTASPASTVIVKMLLEDFDDVPHDFDCRLRVGTVWETADVVQSVTLSEADKRVERTYTFNLPAPTSAFRIEAKGTTVSASNTFHVAERVYYVV
jgi:hypothetical protein